MKTFIRNDSGETPPSSENSIEAPPHFGLIDWGDKRGIDFRFPSERFNEVARLNPIIWIGSGDQVEANPNPFVTF